MTSPDPARLADVQSTLQAGFRVHAQKQRRVGAVNLADELATIHAGITDGELPGSEEISDTKAFFSDTDRNLQRTRKVVEVIEDSMDIGLGHSKLTRIAMSGARLNSGVALVIATHNLLLAADALDTAHERVTAISNIRTERFHDFYRAIAVCIAEGILFTTPINYAIGWKGTRYLNNQFLYKLRYNRFSGTTGEVLASLQRLILSESHYVLRGILPSALHTPEKFVSYLGAMARQTLVIIHDIEDIDISELDIKQLRTRTAEIIEEYRQFAEETYAIPAIDVDLDAIISDVITSVGEIPDVFNYTKSSGIETKEER